MDLTRRPSRWSLAVRLSGLFVFLLAVAVAAFGAAAYRGVRDAATLRASERLASVARELGVAAARGAATRALALQAIAREIPLTREAARPAADVRPERVRDVSTESALVADSRPSFSATSAMSATLASHTLPSDSTLIGYQVLSLRRGHLFGADLAPRDSAVLAAVVATAVRTDSAQRSPFYASAGQIRVWTVVPILSDGRIVGALAEHRRVAASAQTEGLIARLSGQDAQVYFTSRGSTEWASLRGVSEPSPVSPMPFESVADTGASRLRNTAQGTLFVASTRVAGTPWRIVLTQSESSILAAPRSFVNQLLLIGVIVLLCGTLAAWWLSRIETRPLRALRRAADAVAAGDYDQVVLPDGAQETAALADAFNTMSLRISGVHATLAEQNAALHRANEAKARFLAVMSHELRTPLNAIGGHADLIALGVHGDTTPEMRHALERIGRSKDQLLHLVTDILHYARLEATPLVVASQQLSATSIFAALRETVIDQFERKGVALEMVPSEATLCGDAVRVQQVLINLVTNALQFTDSGGRVSVSAEERDAWTTIAVTDTGTGIGADQQSMIFEPFVQADNSLTRRSGGAGLGLAIVRQLAAAMGGHVTVDSTLGVGSTFFVVLPALGADGACKDSADQVESSAV